MYSCCKRGFNVAKKGFNVARFCGGFNRGVRHQRPLVLLKEESEARGEKYSVLKMKKDIPVRVAPH